MDVVDLGDGVRVGAIFEESGQMKPVWFAYTGRRLAIESLLVHARGHRLERDAEPRQEGCPVG